MRMIDADALKENVPDTSADIFENCRNCKTLMDWQVKELIDQQPTVNPWHRVEEELPKAGEFGEIVLACNDVGTVNAAYLSENGKWYAANNTMYDARTWMPNVTHWMPLPEPPKEDA